MWFYAASNFRATFSDTTLVQWVLVAMRHAPSAAVMSKACHKYNGDNGTSEAGSLPHSVAPTIVTESYKFVLTTLILLNTCPPLAFTTFGSD